MPFYKLQCPLCSEVKDDVFCPWEDVIVMRCPKCLVVYNRLPTTPIVQWTGDTSFSVSAGKEPDFKRGDERK